MVIYTPFCDYAYNREQWYRSVVTHISFTSLLFIYWADVRPTPICWKDTFIQRSANDATNGLGNITRKTFQKRWRKVIRASVVFYLHVSAAKYGRLPIQLL